ncbi:hypothetical protein CSV62_12655 [Sporosarcina sp. P35]|nr:hypothetical protein CSV62_12655 [Sporosarcina sp. P35]
MGKPNAKKTLNKKNSTFLYILNFENFFKIGFSKSKKRLKHLGNVYKEFPIDFDESYILECDSISVIKTWERFICSRYIDHLYSFDISYEGMTECFNKNMLGNVMGLINMLIKSHNRVSNDEIKLIRGIVIEDTVIKKSRGLNEQDKISPYLDNVKKEGLLSFFRKNRHYYMGLMIKEDIIEFWFRGKEDFDYKKVMKGFIPMICSYKNDHAHSTVVSGYRKVDNMFIVNMYNSSELEISALIIRLLGELLDCLEIENKEKVLKEIERNKTLRINK